MYLLLKQQRWPFYGPLSGLLGWAGTRRNIHSLIPLLAVRLLFSL